MGRLKTWIDRVRSASPARRAGVCARRRRRLLAFEQFESRIVMSAAVQSTWAADGNELISGALFQELWTITPGSAQWGDVECHVAPLRRSEERYADLALEHQRRSGLQPSTRRGRTDRVQSDDRR